MMSEKRFVVENDIMYDKEREAHFVKMEEVASFLNPLSSENDYLKKENEQLKAKASSWKITCSQEMNEKADLMKQLVSLKEENEQLRQTMQKVCELLEEEVDLFSNEATEHDVIAYREMQDFDNKDAYYICTATKKAIQMLKGGDSDE